MQRIVTILDTALTVNYNDRPISTQKDLDTYKFQFDDSWTGYVKTAVFYTDPAMVKHLLIPEDGVVTIPWEILTGKPQVLYIGVFGTKDTKVKPTTFGAVRLREGSYIDGVAPLPPTPDVYQQIIGAWEGAKADETVRVENENSRRNNFDALVIEYNALKVALEQEIADGTASVDALQALETQYAAKALTLEQTYAPELNLVKSQLAETTATMQAQVDAVVANATLDSEVILARGGKASLDARLDGFDTSISDVTTENGIQMKDTNFIKPGVNLFNKSDPDIIQDYYINSEQVTETLVLDSRLYISGFIEVKANDVIRVPVVLNIITRFMGAYYDKNKNFIVGIKTANIVELTGVRTITVPNNPLIKYVKINGREGTAVDTFMVVRNITYPVSYVAFTKPKLDTKVDVSYSQLSNIPIPLSRWKGEKANFMGDSITYGTNTTKTFHAMLAENIPLAIARNYGANGSNISGTVNAMNQRVLTMDADVDIIFVFGGTNDFKNNIPIGTLYTITNGDRVVTAETTTFYGSLHTMCKNLINTFPGKQYVLMTPIHREVYDGQITSLQDNGSGKYLEDYANAIKEVGKHYGIPVLDLYSISGLQPNEPTNKTLYFAPTDGLHPVLAGHTLIADKIMQFLNTI